QQQLATGDQVSERGRDDAQECERQREDGVREPDEVGVTDEQRLTGKRLRFAHASPSSFHIASTFAFVAASITILLGHSRANPSSFHLRVASIPILDPNVKPRLEWSSKIGRASCRERV